MFLLYYLYIVNSSDLITRPKLLESLDSISNNKCSYFGIAADRIFGICDDTVYMSIY